MRARYDLAVLAHVTLTLTLALGSSPAKSIAKPFHPATLNAPSLAAMAPEPTTPPAESVVTPDPFTVIHETALSLKVEHVFSRDLARDRVAQLLAYWDERFGVKSEWHGFRVFLTGKVLGIAIRALFEIEDGDVVAMAEDPGTLFSGAARRYVDSKLHKYLHPTYQEP